MRPVGVFVMLVGFGVTVFSSELTLVPGMCVEPLKTLAFPGGGVEILPDALSAVSGASLKMGVGC